MEGLGLALVDCFLDLRVELFVDFTVRFRGVRVVAASEVVVVVAVKLESLAYGLASGLPLKEAPPAEGALAAGPLPVPDWPLPVPPLEPPVFPVCASTIA